MGTSFSSLQTLLSSILDLTAIQTTITSILEGFVDSLSLLDPSNLYYVLLLPTILSNLTQETSNYTGLVNNQVWNRTYDYIVIGAGSAGSVMAARLSEDPTKTVLLLEAGGPENIVTNIPVICILLQKTPVDWAFLTVPQNKSCFQLKNRQSSWARGKLMGGSSSINTMLYVRGNFKDYDEWASNGATGWSWPEIFPYFIKMEDNQDPNLVATGYHGVRGPVTVSNATAPQIVSKAFRDSATTLGYGIGDINGPNQTIFANLPQRTIRDGERCSMSKAYLQPLEPIGTKRPNLNILAGAYVRKIIFNGTQAIGVEFDRGGITYTVNASEEIILSAGTINSPKILMLSGIGPAEDLNALNIPVIADLPVGYNLQEHVASDLVFTLNQSVGYNFAQLLSPLTLSQYEATKNNDYTSNFIEGLAFVNTKYANASDGRPDIEFHMIPGSFTTDYGLFFRDIFGITDQAWEQTFEPYSGLPTFLIAPTVLRPKSRGCIKINSTNPYDPPLIDPRFFYDDYDLDVLVEGMKIALALVAQSPQLQKYNATPIQTLIPGCEGYVLYSDDYLRCTAQSLTTTIWHPSGTCKMGAINDPTAVVDPQLRVIGIQGLRVVDQSIMPTVISGNTNCPTAAIAEKISDNMKGKQIIPFVPPMNQSMVNGLPQSLITQPFTG